MAKKAFDLFGPADREKKMADGLSIVYCGQHFICLHFLSLPSLLPSLPLSRILQIAA